MGRILMTSLAILSVSFIPTAVADTLTSCSRDDSVCLPESPKLMQLQNTPVVLSRLNSTTKDKQSSRTTSSTATSEYTAAIPLEPAVALKLTKGGTDAVTWPEGLQAISEAVEQLFYLRKCSGTDASSCLGNDAAWTTTNSAILSGDVVAWVSKPASTVYSCGGGKCIQQAYPPQKEYWRTPLRIVKLASGGEAEAEGTPIYMGDSVYFYGMLYSEWYPTNIINCDATQCKGMGKIAEGTFVLEEWGCSTALSKYELPLDFASKSGCYGIDHWAICALAEGYITGHGYGCEISAAMDKKDAGCVRSASDSSCGNVYKAKPLSTPQATTAPPLTPTSDSTPTWVGKVSVECRSASGAVLDASACEELGKSANIPTEFEYGKSS